MKYSIDIIVKKPLSEVVRKFTDTSNYKEWMEGFIKVEHLSEEKDKEGAEAMFYIMHKNCEMKIKETLLKNNLPKSIKFKYENKSTYNTVETHFQEINGENVKILQHNYFKFTGMMKVFAWLMPSMFKKQSMKYLTSFKNFVEK